MIKSLLIRIAIVLVVIVVVLLGRGFFFYTGDFYRPLLVERPKYEDVVIPPAPMTEFSDVYKERKGAILIDLAHNNAFAKEELNVLLLRLVSRGLTVRFFTEKGELKKELLGEEEKDEEGKPADEKEKDEEGKPADEKEKEKKEPLPDAFLVISPRLEFSKEERKAVDEFVDKGGKLVLMADPTRRSEINSLALQFALIFESDFLYNMKENEINYRNIFITDFKENEITKELKKIVLYAAGSISSSNSSLAFVDENTFSSVIETRGKLAPIALAQESKVLAIYDLTFMTEPYNGTLDNNRLIANIADWLMPRAKGAALK